MVESAILTAVRTKNNIQAIIGLKELFIGGNQIANLLRPNEILEEKAWALFLKINTPEQEKPISYVDCMNIAMSQQNHIESIVSFDSHYKGWLKIIS